MKWGRELLSSNALVADTSDVGLSKLVTTGLGAAGLGFDEG
jgi:hypothetical protein